MDPELLKLRAAPFASDLRAYYQLGKRRTAISKTEAVGLKYFYAS
jgi:hypothetical protein